MQPPLHDLLSSQLKRLGLSSSSPPATVDEWNMFLTRISTQYDDHDNYAYLIKQSLEISSQEMSALNSRLEESQHIAHLGYWIYDLKTQRVALSSEMRSILGYLKSENTPDYNDILKIVHPDDIEKFQQVTKSSSNNNSNDVDIRIHHRQTGKVRWIQYKVNHALNSENTTNNLITGIAIDITQRKEMELQAEETNHQLLLTARRAGMAEIATAVLHNIGNVLNSVNVSVGIVIEGMSDANMEKLAIITRMIRENKANLGEYFSNDTKGKLIPEYLVSLTSHLTTVHQSLNDELKSINNHIQHIKDIISAQQSLSGMSGISESVSVSELIENALQIGGGSFKSHNISVIKKYDKNLFLNTDRSKITQVLINLIQNAKEAMKDASIVDKCLIIEVICSHEDNYVILSIEDNGVGIPQDIINKLFTFGFTTKKEGHGFGLHSCAIIAKELGGSLTVESKGLGHGAKFILKLPTVKSVQMNKLQT